MQKEPRSFRLTVPGEHKNALLHLLAAQGFDFEPLPFYNDAFMLKDEPMPLGSSLAAQFGLIYIQDPSSMLPALALLGRIGTAAQHPGTAQSAPAVLDLCSSPGGKSSLLARDLPKESLVLANEPGGKRMLTLRRNLETMNMLNAASSAFSGERLPIASASAPPPSAGSPFFRGWDYILLDPPCSGWGTVDKNPQVLNLWQGDKIKPLIGLQKMLLREGARLLKPGGRLVYSTCTVNVHENEEQIALALRELNEEFAAHGYSGTALQLDPLRPFPGFKYDDPELGLEGVLRVSMESPMGQGFFLAAVAKSHDAPALPPLPAPVSAGQEKSGKKRKKSDKISQEPPLTPFTWQQALDNPDLSKCFLETLSAGQKKLIAGSGLEFSETLPPESIKAPLLSPALLPPGKLLLQKDRLLFFHQSGLSRLPASFAWQGFPLGRSPQGGRPRPETGLRALMPKPDKASANGADVLNLDEIAPIKALLSGQSLSMQTQGPEVGLYFMDLPLCRLKARNGRVFL